MWSSGHNMREVVVDASDGRISSHNLRHHGSSLTANVHQGIEGVEALVLGQNNLHHDSGIAGHGIVEQWLKSG